MRILFSCIPFDDGKSGISVYMRNVARELRDDGHELTLLVEDSAAPEFKDYRCIVAPHWCGRSLILGLLYHWLVLPFVLLNYRFDRVIFGAANRRMGVVFNQRTLAVVHDLSQYHVPVKYDIFRMWYIKHLLPFFVRRADRVVAISRSTSRDLRRYWRIPSGKITVNYNGIDREGLPINGNDQRDPVVLYVSRLEAPGKNHANLISAWEMLPDAITDRYRLVLAGADWSGAESIHARAEASPKRDSIKFVGFIGKDELYNEYYKHCSLYCFPSFFEGFGLSLIEAMACGVVSVCSNNSSLGEIAGDAALTFDPGDPVEIAKCIENGLTDERLRSVLRERGLRRAESFNWDIHAQLLASPLHSHGEVFRVRFFTGTMAQALNDIDLAVKDKKRRRPFFGAFINADCLNQAYNNRDYAAILAEADQVWPDGVGVSLAASHAGTPVMENINGTDMLPLLCARNYSLFLLGGAPGVATEAQRCLEEEYHGIRILGAEHGFFKDDKALLAKIRSASPDILLVAMGVPRQEEWIYGHLDRLNCRVAIGVGGLLDFASRRIPRAPLWMRKLRMEWCFRLACEPVRLFRRYVIGNPLFLWRVWFSRKKF